VEKAARSIVLGTAGHIDHGKTTLVRALTGIDTDRLPEEKRRGITIELGFAPWVIAPGLEASIVDVPGHESFVRTMVAGAGGIDAVILVVSAEDGVMPQTREHVNVCELLGVRRGIVALTKTDQLGGDAEVIELAVDDVRTGLAGSVFADAQIIPCSGVTGEGVSELREAVHALVREIPGRDAEGVPILPLDRVFSMKGHGTVVAGTLLAGTIDLRRETTLMLQPTGDGRLPREVRARALQIRSSDRARALAGTRVALNLAGMDLSEIHRGDVITDGPRVVRTTALHARLSHLAHGQRAWKHGTTCQICAGTAHDVARLDPLYELEDPEARAADPVIAPGREGLVRVRLQAPIPTWRDQRIILRGFDDPTAKGTTAVSYGRTLGGGLVIDPQPSSGRSQRKRWIELGRALQEPEASARLEALVLDSAALGIGLEELERRSGVASPERELEKLAGKNGPVVAIGGNRFVHRDRTRKLVDVAIAAVDRFHAEQPMQPGLNRAALESMLPPPVAPDVASRVVDMAIERGALRAVDDKGTVARPGKGLEAGGGLPPDVKRVLDAYVAAGITAPTIKDLEQQCGLSHRQVLDIVGILQRTGRIVRITADISLAKESHDDLIERIRAHLGEHGTIDVQALKQMTGLSRKYAVPFLEHVDQLLITRRQGDLRVPGPRA